jgi:hypothetical protein
MKDLIAITIAGALLWWVALWPMEELRAEEIKEFSIKTWSGEVVLTREPCEFIKMGVKDYPYAAYAVQKGHPHVEGCWTMDIVDRFKAVKVYFPQTKSIEYYNPSLFEPRLTKPSL